MHYRTPPKGKEEADFNYYSLRAAIAAVFILAVSICHSFAVGLEKHRRRKTRKLPYRLQQTRRPEKNTPAAVVNGFRSAVTLSASSELQAAAGITDWTYTSSDTAPSGIL